MTIAIISKIRKQGKKIHFQENKKEEEKIFKILKGIEMNKY